MSAIVISFVSCILQIKMVMVAPVDLPESCPKDMHFSEIPPTHLFQKMEKPLIIAHRGQPKKFQENTKEGILSSLDIKADGFELDIFKTKDNKLIVFHDNNALKLTGVNKIVYESTYAELQELNLTTQIEAGGVNYRYDKSRKIPLLEDVLKETAKHNILHYLEMKPSDPFTAKLGKQAKETGELVAKMIEKFNLFDKAIVVSFDFRKVYAVKKINPNITVGTLFSQTFSIAPKVVYLSINPFNTLSQCLLDAPNDTLPFFQFILNSGVLFKASGSASFDCDIALYNNPSYSNDTLNSLRQNYGNYVSTGFYTVYSMGKTEIENTEDERKLKRLLADGGGQRLITDDVPRLRKLLGRYQISVANNMVLSPFVFVFMAFMVKFAKEIN